MSKPVIATVGVVGLGLIGASILKDIRRHEPGVKRLGISQGDELKVALKEGLIEDSDFKTLVNTCDLIFIATPIDTVDTVAKDIAKSKTSLKKLIVTDVASVKNTIIPLFEQLTTESLRFIPSHPMGGSEKSGYHASRGGLFRQKPWIICADEVKPETQLLADFLERNCGVRIEYLSPGLHDKYVAAASHAVIDLSHLLFDFISKKHPEVLKIAGESFITTTRLASDNPTMLSGIHEHNLQNIKDIIEEFTEFIEAKMKSGEDFNLEYFTRNKMARDSWVYHRNKQ